MLNRIRNLRVGQSLRWENPPMSAQMIRDAVNVDGRLYRVAWVTTNWEASQGYCSVERIR